MSHRSHVVIGTAGHVDHGKTSLVTALTGTNCDRLPEEKRRGITIDLGFARWELAGLSASIVDVPGHERFVSTMVAGASGLDLVMLVVAADDGVMPQTREHLAICEELGVRAGVVVVTKCDLVDDEMLELVTDDVRAATEGTFLAGAELVRCSVKDGRGIGEVAPAVLRALGTIAESTPTGAPWMSVDRVFTKHGFGTIVTGTLVRGSIATLDGLEAMPLADGGIDRVVVRGMSIHGSEVERATATTRLALNLRGVDRERLSRGAVLAAPGSQRPTTAVDVELHLLPDARRLDPRTELALHVGTAHATVRARPLAPWSLGPGERGIVRLTLSAPLAVHVGQRFVLRRPELGAHRTVAGGAILDPHPLLGRRRKGEPRAWLVPSADLPERIVAMVGESPSGTTLSAINERVPPDVDAERLLEPLMQRRVVIAVRSDAERRFFSSTHLERARKAVLASVASFHREHAALSGATVAEVEGRLPVVVRPLAGAAIAALRKEGALAGGERVSLPSHDSRVMCDRVAEIYREAGLSAGTDESMEEQSGLTARAFRDVVLELVREARLHRLAAGVHFHERALAELRARVLTYFDTSETLSPGDFKTLTGLTRKNAIALLEWLDKQGVTRRKGDQRVRG